VFSTRLVSVSFTVRTRARQARLDDDSQNHICESMIGQLATGDVHAHRCAVLVIPGASFATGLPQNPDTISSIKPVWSAMG
jgi:hypothetical protein